jgi:capsular polysaccharide biosynthesis protein
VKLRDYAGVARRNWLVILMTIVVGVGAAAGLALVSPTKYQSSAQMVFSGHSTTSGQDLGYTGGYVQGRMQTYKKIGASGNVLAGVRKQLGTKESIEDLRDRITFEVNQLSTVMTVSATDSSPKRAARTANIAAQALLNSISVIEGVNAARPSRGKAASATVEGLIIEPATPEETPFSPNWPLYLVAGLITGLVVSVGLVAVREVLKGEPETAEGG